MKLLKFPAAKRQLILLALAGFATVCSSTVSAQQVIGPYIGGNLGATRSDFNNGDVNRYLTNRGFTVNSSAEDRSSTGGKLFGGYQFTPYFALEGGYFDLGKFDYRAYAQNRANFTSTGLAPVYTGSTRSNGTNLKVGVGVQYAITEALAFRAELERYRINDPIRSRGHVDMASLGLIYRFGAKVPTPVAQAYVPVAAPVYVAPPAPVVVAPAPVVVAPPPVYVEPARPPKQGRN